MTSYWKRMTGQSSFMSGFFPVAGCYFHPCGTYITIKETFNLMLYTNPLFADAQKAIKI